ncbi:unnamed protein product [Arctogadus glacialis]
MPTLQRRQSPLQNSPYCLVSEFEGEQPEGEESRPNQPLGNRRCPLPFSQTKGMMTPRGSYCLASTVYTWRMVGISLSIGLCLKPG